MELRKSWFWVKGNQETFYFSFNFLVLISLAPPWARWLVTSVLSAVQGFFFPRKLKWEVSPDKSAHTLAIHFEIHVSLWSGTGWLVCILFFVHTFDLLVSLSPPRMCVTTLALSLQPGYCGYCLTLETRGTWVPALTLPLMRQETLSKSLPASAQCSWPELSETYVG